jgi:hypothetical protein
VNPTDLVIEYQGANYDNIVTTSTIWEKEVNGIFIQMW